MITGGTPILGNLRMVYQHEFKGGPVNVRFKHWDNGVWDGLGQNSTAKAG